LYLQARDGPLKLWKVPVKNNTLGLNEVSTVQARDGLTRLWNVLVKDIMTIDQTIHKQETVALWSVLLLLLLLFLQVGGQLN